MAIALPDLNHHTHFLTEQGRQGGSALAIDGDIEATSSGKGHFQQRHQQATVGTIVVGQYQVTGFELINQVKQGPDIPSGHIGHLCRQGTPALGQYRGTQPILPPAQVNHQ